MAFIEDPSIVNEDWRINVVTTLAAPVQLKTFHAAGERIKEIAEVGLDQKHSVLSFGVPNICALLIDSAQKLYASGNDYFASLTPGSGNVVNLDKVEGPLFDALESRMGCVVFSFTAIEAYANARIMQAYEQTKYVYSQTNRSGITITMTLDDIQRRVTIEEKLLSILPNILGVKLARGRSIWSAFKNMKRIRDRIIHCKKADLMNSKPRDKTLWQDLASSRFPNAPKDALELIGFFENTAPSQYRWFAKRPV